jgi:hypothetical protein
MERAGLPPLFPLWGAMQLSSYQRMRRYLGGKDDDNDMLLEDTRWHERQLTNLIMATSKRVENYLDRDLTYGTHTEYFDVDGGEVEFFVKAYPIASITSIVEDSSGLHDGSSESTLTADDYHIGSDSRSVVFRTARDWRARRGLKITYVGGMAYNGVRSKFIVPSTTDWTASTANTLSWCFGETSYATGIVRTVATNSITVENIFGEFDASETIVEYTDESLTTSDASTTITSISEKSLAEAYPDLVLAAEQEIRYKWDHKLDYELTGTNKDGTNLRSLGTTRRLPFVAESYEILKQYKRPVVF